MRTRKAVITLALAGAALAATAASSSAFAATPYVGHNVGGGLVTRQPLTVGQRIDLLGREGRITDYRVTGVSRNGDSYYDTVWPRISSGGTQVLSPPRTTANCQAGAEAPVVITAMGASACRRKILLPTVKVLAGIVA